MWGEPGQVRKASTWCGWCTGQAPCLALSRPEEAGAHGEQHEVLLSPHCRSGSMPACGNSDAPGSQLLQLLCQAVAGVTWPPPCQDRSRRIRGWTAQQSGDGI